jgi:hypothetical protein
MYFVYHENRDGGYVVLEDFETHDQAKEFIENSLNHSRSADIEDYRVIRGEELELSAVQVATRVEMKPKR